jgi:hypothetical protein
MAKHASGKHQITDAVTGRREARRDMARVRREVKAVVAHIDEDEAAPFRRLVEDTTDTKGEEA